MPPRDLPLVVLGCLAVGLSISSNSMAQPKGTAASTATQPEPEAAPAPSRAAQLDANTCLTCHRSLPGARLSRVAEQFELSVHRDPRIGCAGCHGGRATDPTVSAHAAEAGFVAYPRHDKIAEICGGCHADPVFVRRFQARLPIDQKKLFALSRHGQLSSAGDTRAPTCTNCHGSHAIAPVASPLAPVHASQVVTLCARCHTDPEYMAPYGLDTRQVDQWQRSVHGEVFQSGNHAAPTCTGCHSPHAGKLPGSAAVEVLCDRCHTDERDFFRESPHNRAFRRLGLGECVPCHGSHAVQRPHGLLGMGPESACARCHATDARARQVAKQLGGLLRDIDEREQRARAALARAKGEGLYVPGAEHALGEVSTARLRLAANAHTLNVERITTAVRAAVPMAEKVQQLVRQARGEKDREWRGYLAALCVAGLLFALLVLKAVRLARRRPPAP